MPPGGAAGDAAWSEHSGQQDVQEVGEGQEEDRRQAGGCEAEAPRRGQPPDREGRRRRPRAGYISAMPGWKSDVGSRLDALIVRNVPDVRKAVKWNSPFYGIEGQG